MYIQWSMTLPKKGRTFWYRLEVLNCKHLLSHSSAGRRLMIEVTQMWSHVRVLLLACSQLPPHCILTWHPCLHLRLLIKLPVLLDQGPTLRTSFTFNSLPKGHIFRDSPIGEVMVRSAQQWPRHGEDTGKVRNFGKIHFEEALLGTTRCLPIGGSRSSPWNTLTPHLLWVTVWLLAYQTPSWDLTISPVPLLTLPRALLCSKSLLCYQGLCSS